MRLRAYYKFILRAILFGAFLTSIFYLILDSKTSSPVDIENENSKMNDDVSIKSAIDKLKNYNETDRILDGIQPEKIDWEDYEQTKRESSQTGPGEGGTAVILNAEQSSMSNKTLKLNGFSIFISDMISVNRSVKDLRDGKCKGQLYGRILPSVSVVIPVFEEHLKTLLRTIYSTLNRAPPGLIKEIILVDDGSSRKYLKEELDNTIKDTFPSGVVKAIHLQQRQGLIRARIEGAKVATADIIIFLDSHCEAGINWLPPLIEPIALDYRTVTCPLIDIVHADTFEYLPQDNGARGVFDWVFGYQRIPKLPEDELKPEKPFPSPVMAGGLFAISRKWFWELGGYDPGLQIWGGEQYEISFKIWMCGGRLLDIPCSRIGHIYRGHPTSFPEPNLGNFLGKNFKRVAEVWMDEYKEYIYLRHPEYKDIYPGDLTVQHDIRKRLKCKSFRWFLEEVAPDLTKMYPVIDPIPAATGKIRSLVQPDLCIDAKKAGKTQPVYLSKCIRHDTDANGQQIFEHSFHDDIQVVDTKNCFDVPQSRSQAPIVLFPCHAQHGNQHFEIRFIDKPKDNPIRIRHVTTDSCIDFDPQNFTLYMNPCDPYSKTQQWRWDTLQIDLAAESRRKVGV